MTAPTPPSDGQTVTLSDGSVWHYVRHADDFICDAWSGSPQPFAQRRPSRMDGDVLTAEDHRKIADVLDPPESSRVPAQDYRDIRLLRQAALDLRAHGYQSGADGLAALASRIAERVPYTDQDLPSQETPT